MFIESCDSLMGVERQMHNVGFVSQKIALSVSWVARRIVAHRFL